MVGDFAEPAIGNIKIWSFENYAKLQQAVSQSASAGMFAKNHAVVRHSDGRWLHNFIREWVCQHAVLMDPSLVRECVAADHGLIR